MLQFVHGLVLASFMISQIFSPDLLLANNDPLAPCQALAAKSEFTYSDEDSALRKLANELAEKSGLPLNDILVSLGESPHTRIGGIELLPEMDSFAQRVIGNQDPLAANFMVALLSALMKRGLWTPIGVLQNLLDQFEARENPFALDPSLHLKEKESFRLGGIMQWIRDVAFRVPLWSQALTLFSLGLLVTLISACVNPSKHPRVDFKQAPINLKDNKVLVHFKKTWKGPRRVLLDVLPQVADHVDHYARSLDILTSVRITDKQVVEDYFKRIDEIDTIADPNVKKRALKDFQSTTYTLHLLAMNLTLTDEKAGELFTKFVAIELPEDAGDDVYADWIADELTPVVRASLKDWDVEVTDGVKTSGGAAANDWDGARWQDVIMRGLVGIYFQDKIYAPSEGRMKKIREILNAQGAVENKAGEYLFYLSYGLHLSLLPPDILAVLPGSFASKHDFTTADRWENAHFHGGAEPYVTGNLFFLPSELSHLYESLIQKVVLDAGGAYPSAIHNSEFEDRLGALGMMNSLPFLTYPDAQDWVDQTVELGIEMVNHSSYQDETLEILWELMSRDKYDEIRELLRAGKPTDALAKMTPSELYYLGKISYKNLDVPENSSARKALKKVEDSLQESGISKEEFQEELDAAVGVFAYTTYKVTWREEVTLTSYATYTGKHSSAERHTVDFIVHFVRLNKKEGVSPGAQPFLIVKAMRYLYEKGDPTKTITENIKTIGAVQMRQWIQELKDEGIIKEGAPMKLRDRLKIRELFRARDKLGGEIARIFDDPERSVKQAGLSNASFAFGFIFIGMLGLLARRKSFEEEDVSQMIKRVPLLDHNVLLTIAINEQETFDPALTDASRQELLKRIVTAKMSDLFQIPNLNPERFTEALSALAHRLMEMGISFDSLSQLNLLPHVADQLVDRWLFFKVKSLLDKPGASGFSVAA